MEKFTPAQRSRVMAKVRSRDTAPELIVRRLVHKLGHRFRLHRRDLPGTPDLVLARLRKIINVNGCFWHLHRCRHGRIDPVNNAAYWTGKRRRNQANDRRNIRRLRAMGWQVLVLWECQLKRPDEIQAKISAFLKRRSSSPAR